MLDTVRLSTVNEGATSYGRLLRDRREALGLSYREIAAMTKIQASVLQSLEEERLEAFDALAYARGFARLYARELGLDEQQVLDVMPRELSGLPVWAEAAEAPSDEAAPSLLALWGARRERRAAAADRPVAEPAPAAVIEATSGLPRFVLTAALSVLVLLLAGTVLFFQSEAGVTSAAATAPGADDTFETWRPAPRELIDWQTVIEN